MKLTVLERLYLPTILPAKGKYIEVLQVQQIKQAIEFTTDEIEYYNLRDTDRGVSFDRQKIDEKDFQLSLSQLKIIQDTLDNLSERGEFTEDLIPLYQRLNSM